MTMQETLQQAIEHHQSNQLQEAEKLYRAILAQAPDHPDANHNLGVLAMQVNKPEVALSFFEKAIQVNPEHPQYQQSLKNAKAKLEQSPLVISQDMDNRLVSLFTQQKYEEVLRLAREAVEKDPDYAFGWKVVGTIEFMMKDYTNALPHYKKALRLNPQDAEVHCNLGAVLQDLGRLEESEASCRQAIRLKPDLAEAHNNLSDTLRDLGRLEESEASSREAIRLKPDYAKAHNNLGNALIELGRLKESEASYRQAIRLKPDLAEAHNNLGNALIELGRLEESKASYRQAFHLKQDFNSVIENLMSLNIQLNIQEKMPSFAENNLMAKIYLIIYLFINKLFKEIEPLIYELKKDTYQHLYMQLNAKNKVFFDAYLGFLSKLNGIALGQENQLITTEKENILYHIGESHCLSFAHQTVKLNDQKYTVKPLIIFGAKAWHFANQEKKSFLAFFENHIRQLPIKAKVIVSFGEIDTRENEGIIEYHLKSGKDLKFIVKKTIDGYIEYTQNIINRRNIEAYYMGVPAPVIKDSDENKQLRIEVVKEFNKYLSFVLKKHDLKFIDTYKLTVNNQGSSNLKYMIDNRHLHPNLLSRLFEFSE